MYKDDYYSLCGIPVFCQHQPHEVAHLSHSEMQASINTRVNTRCLREELLPNLSWRCEIQNQTGTKKKKIKKTGKKTTSSRGARGKGGKKEGQEVRVTRTRANGVLHVRVPILHVRVPIPAQTGV